MPPRVPILLPVLSLLLCASASAQALFTRDDGVTGNGAAGQSVYAQACAVCHGPRLEGSAFAPTLAGRTFIDKWRGKPPAELLKLMRETMPPKGLGALEPGAYPDLLAFLVRANLEPATLTAQAAAASAPAASAAVTTPPSAAAAPRLAALTAASDALLAAPPESDWLMWRRTFDAAGFSPLRKIDGRNVAQLRKAWSLPLAPSTNEIAPLVHDGVLFAYSGTVLVAVDAANGAPLWKFERPLARAANAPARFDPGRQARVKSIALYGHALYVPTPDGHVLAIDARNGQLLWDRKLQGDGPNTGLQLSSGPLVARGVVMIGASLGLSNKGGCFIVALDAATGKERWRFNTVARPGTPGGDTWNDAPADERFGGGVWTTGSYDATLDLAYFGVGNTYNTATLLQPRPGATRVTRNDGLYTNTTLALRPETGELVWHYQHHVRDVWDQDWAFEQTLVTLGTGADARRAVVTSGKGAIFEALDASTGRFLFSQDNGLTNLFLGIDAKTGAKTANPALEPAPGKTLLVCPSNLGARNWPATSLDAANGFIYVSVIESCADFTWQPRPPNETANGGTDIRFQPRPRPDGDGKLGRMMAIDLKNRRVLWTHRQRVPLVSSLLATAGGVVFMGDLDRNFGAWDRATGKPLWQTRLPANAESTPVTYAVGDRQFVAVVTGEGSHLGTQHRKLVPELGDMKTDIELVVFALPGN